MSVRNRASLAIGVVTMMLATIACIGAGPVAAAAGPVSIPVAIDGGLGLPGGAQPMVELRVGRSVRVPVVLDTGSSGLHIFANVVPTGPTSGVGVTSTPADITYAGGHRFVGVLATATIHIGAQATARPTPFALVNDAVCIASKPTCPAAGGIAGFERRGVYGILGIGTATSRGPVASPILDMPARLSTTWSLQLHGSDGTLVLGAQPPRATTLVATIAMKRTGTWGTHALWADAALHVCTTVSLFESCAPTLFDSGTAAFQLWGPAFAPVPVGTSAQVAPGIPVTLSLSRAASPFWSFTTGTTRSKNLVVSRGGANPFVNVGIQGYFAFTITYDDGAGVVSLSHAHG